MIELKLKRVVVPTFFATLIIFFASPSAAQVDTLRVATYNLLNFPSSDGLARIPYFRTAVHSLQPDILVVQELESDIARVTFLNEVMNHGQTLYSAAPFVDGPDTDSGLFFDNNKIQFKGQNVIPTTLRNINGYELSAFGVDFKIHSVHLKAGSFPSDASRRFLEATVLRTALNDLPANFNFIVVGDFNFQSSNEDAFVRLTEDESDNDGKVFDPINQLGEWNENIDFRLIHTQSTRTTSFGDGATGGLDDRFDLILVSQSVLAEGGMAILPASYTAFGNDGEHFNQAINDGTNLAVPDSVADALHLASDHLPVVANFVFGAITAVEAPPTLPEKFILYQNYPNPFNPTTTIKFYVPATAPVSLKVYDLVGREVAVLVDEVKPAGEFAIDFDAAALASGIYFYVLKTSKFETVRKMIFLR